MTNFGPEWPLWDLKVSHSQLVDRITHPLEGLALIELDVDPQILLLFAAQKALQLPTDALRSYRYWQYASDQDGNMTHDAGLLYDEFLELVGDEKRLADVNNSVREATREVHEAFGEKHDTHSVAMLGFKRARLGENHADTFETMNTWLGATQPGLKVLHKGVWLNVDGMPAGHGLVWRGETPNHPTGLVGTRHKLSIRRTIPRFSLFSVGKIY